MCPPPLQFVSASFSAYLKILPYPRLIQKHCDTFQKPANLSTGRSSTRNVAQPPGAEKLGLSALTVEFKER